MEENKETPQEDSVEKKVEDLQKKVTSVLELDKLSEMIVNNCIEYEHKGIQYRANRPNFKQKQEANEKRVEKFTQLMKDEKYMLEDQLIDMYKKKGIDIKKMDSELTVIDKQRQDYLFKLGQAIKEGKENQELLTYKEEIQKLNVKQQDLMMRRAVLMDTSLESQINVLVFTYLAFLTTEKKDGENWVRTWTQYDDFMNSEESLINLSVFYASFLSRAEL